MKVLMTADAVGGVWTYALELARALARRDARVALATMGPPPSDEQRREALAVPGLALEASEFKLEWMREPWADVEKAGEWLLGLERRHAPDVVHLNGYAHAALPWRAPTLVAGHSCVWGWLEAVRGQPPGPEWARYRREVAAGLRAAEMVVAPTRAMLDSLRRHYGDWPAPSRVVPNGRDPAPFRAAPRKEPFVLGVGRLWDEAKGMATLGEAAAGLPWEVRLVGDARHPDGGGERAPFGHARLLGRLPWDALRDQYSRASVYVNPARYEPFGLGALEAALSGCALVLSDLSTLREVWGDAALYAPPGDADALRDALLRLAEDDDLRRAMAERAHARARRLTADAMAGATLSAYEELTRLPQEASSCAS